MNGTTTLERMPEGAVELIPLETAVTPTDDRQGHNIPVEAAGRQHPLILLLVLGNSIQPRHQHQTGGQPGQRPDLGPLEQGDPWTSTWAR